METECASCDVRTGLQVLLKVASISQLTVSRMSRQCGILNISQPYRSPRPVTGIALLYCTTAVYFSNHHCNCVRETKISFYTQEWIPYKNCDSNICRSAQRNRVENWQWLGFWFISQKDSPPVKTNANVALIWIINSVVCLPVQAKKIAKVCQLCHACLLLGFMSSWNYGLEHKILCRVGS
jgi:hypothetical protein